MRSPAMRSPAIGSRALRLLAGTASVCLAGAAAYAIGTAPAHAAASDPYTWKNVEVHGGGFVDGIIYNKSRQNLVYARTDIGGSYRWNPSTARWIPLQDFTAPGDWNLLGTESLATDPVDPNRPTLTTTRPHHARNATPDRCVAAG